ncbi:IclR family transcriptional regulator [Ornithinimicrobium cavernae]|uniref:IclR family transcriptional regulator n=1 Tax=Ornithinimicrobium cavernae TaxID=2666047 RepID=UPI000D69A56F|nr:IclR family transcriptional regulator [Ornithinimicrobium cavernae]
MGRSEAPAAGHALAVLRLLSRHAGPLPAASIARSLGLPRSTTYRLLGVLVEHGFVVHLPEERRYGLGVGAFELGSAYSRQEPMQRLARPLLSRLADRTGHNAHLVVLHGRDVLYVIEERVVGRPSLVTDVGVRLPASLTASGLAVLAALPSAQVRALYPSPDAFVQRNGQGPTSLSGLRRVLTTVRADGFASESHSVTPGLASVASAVLDHNGHPVAGIAVTYPVDEVDETARSGIVAATRWCAGELTRRLGGAPRS